MRHFPLPSLLLSIFLTIASSISCLANEEYIGLTQIPANLKSMGGWLIRDTKYSVSQVAEVSCTYRPCSAEIKQMLWLEKIIRHNQGGKVTHEVLDVIELPSGYEKDFTFQLSKYCRVNNVESPEVFAITRFESDKDIFTDIKKAWKVNLSTIKFEEISTENVTCINIAGADYN